MRTRLVVGQGRLARTVVDVLTGQSDPVYVLADDRRYAESLDTEVRVERGDPTDPEALSAVGEVDSVLALDASAGRNAAILSASEEPFPGAFTLAYLGDRPDPERETLRRLADRVIDPVEATVEALTGRLGAAGDRAMRLRSALRADDEPLAVITHDNPDPDAIASGIALSRLAASVGRDCEVCYFGSISHQENRAFVNLLDLDLRNLDPDADLAGFGGVALVDHSRPGVNDQLPEDLPVDIVIDHHPPRGPVDAEFVDLRSDVGATSTLMIEYFQQFGLLLDETIATALLFGIRIDTDEFSREVSVADFEAGAQLVAVADLSTLERIESPSMDPDTLETIGTAITNRERHGQVLVSGVGHIRNRDALAQAADRLLDLEGVTTTLVHGIGDHTVYVSARARGAEFDLGELLRDAYGPIGSAGGHADMAGAQIELGVLDAVDPDDESLTTVVDEVIGDRFLEVLRARWSRPMRPYSGDEYVAVGDVRDLTSVLRSEDLY